MKEIMIKKELKLQTRVTQLYNRSRVYLRATNKVTFKLPESIQRRKSVASMKLWIVTTKMMFEIRRNRQ